MYAIRSYYDTTAMQVREVPSKIRPHSDRKIALAMGSFHARVDAAQISYNFV